MAEIPDVELRWRASALTRAIATCAALALAVGLIRSCWQLIAFAAPLLGVLCSISWQRPLPKVNVHAEPGSQRCFEAEQTELQERLTLGVLLEGAGLPDSAPETRDACWNTRASRPIFPVAGL